ncbi:glucoamylase family protein [Oscillospiraceae bacterium MB08-C2-2]|nr:glucoamylase family protein [Oscillospiraceae bacterium MB08-C2-2]
MEKNNPITPKPVSASAQSLAQSSAQLRRSLLSQLSAVRQCYIDANQSAERTPVSEWLCDNYYVLEKECKQSVKDIRHLSKHARKDELIEVYHHLFGCITKELPEIDNVSVTAILSHMGRQWQITEAQFSFTPTAMRAVLIHMAYTACLQTQSEQWIRYAITGLSQLSSVNFDKVITTCSEVEKTLLKDPAGIYGNMTSESRHHYRRLVAIIAAKTQRSELDVATECLEKSSASTGARQHIGYFILESPIIRLPRLRRGKASLIAGVLMPLAASVLLGWIWRDWGLSLLCFLPLWELLRTPIQQGALHGVEVDFIPRMDLSRLASKPRTVVLVSTLLPKASEALHLTARLEQLYFSNSDPDMYYCILADFKECEYPEDAQDESQIAASCRVIEELNQKYNQRFMLFLRGRVYNKTQKKYSGWERKRGAITEFIRFLKGEETSLHTFMGDRSALDSIRYVVALDSDTCLLYESAQTLVATAMHPLNRPVIGEQGIVTRGYGILVPRISTDLNSAGATPFSRVMSGCGGVTAYDTKNKDFYQDLFFESIFSGKGLIDVDTFYELLNNRFPENHVLSHDILEGAYLRAGFVSDVEMTDSAPSNMLSWLSRLHRWTRGDWQNIVFIAGRWKCEGKWLENPISSLSKYKLFDNLRRSLVPVAAVLCVIAALILPSPSSTVLAVVAGISITFSSIWAACWSLFSSGFFTMSRKFFTRTLPHTFELLGQGLFFLVMLLPQAILSTDALCRSLFRTFVSHHKMLEWTTAAQADTRKITFAAVLKRFWLPQLLAMLLVAFSGNGALTLLGLALSLLIPIAWFSAQAGREDNHSLENGDRDTLISYNAAMWRYYEDFANQENHFLPPDNIQQSPVYRVARRTSPTNIGMMMLSVLAARDMDFVDTPGLYRRLERTLSTVEKLEKWNGNLYNWYDTETLEILQPAFVSTVDSGNLICCLVALKEGLSEFSLEYPPITGLIDRLGRLIEATDLIPLYNKEKNLFSIGWDEQSGVLNQSHYDFLMSEARLTSYYAVARKLIPRKHWGALNRTMSRNSGYAGAVSWTGTMFEYFMPHLLLPAYEGSLLNEGLIYCLYCQKRRVKNQAPWGISESAYYAFDNFLNYQYKAHGVQKIGVKRHLDKELVISPYSTFITIPFNPNSSMANLSRLHRLGVYGRYGFYEAVDFTPQRVGAASLAVTRSFMAHHIGMSMIASCNALFDNRMQRRFMNDHYMESAKEFLQEKIAKSTVIYDELKHPVAGNEKRERPAFRDQSAYMDPQAPKAVLLSNGELTEILTDVGAGYLKFGDIDLTRHSSDLLRRAQGVLVLVRCAGNVTPAAYAPFYKKDVAYSVEYLEQAVTYYAKRNELELGVRCMAHPTVSCIQKQILIKNTSSGRQLMEVLIYMEPVLSLWRDYDAHSAFSKLFVSGSHSSETRTLTFTRRNRDSSNSLYLSVGFLEDIDFQFELTRENLMEAPEGLSQLLRFDRLTFTGKDGGVPDCCCALRTDVLVNPGSQRMLTLLISAAHTRTESVQNILSMRKMGPLETSAAAKSPVLGDGLSARLGSNLLGKLLFEHTSQKKTTEALGANTLGQPALWATGISGDIPLVLLELTGRVDEEMTVAYIKIQDSLRRLGVEFDLCFLHSQEEHPKALPILLEIISKAGADTRIGIRGGLFPLCRENFSPETITLLRAAARCTIQSGADPHDGPADIFSPVEFKEISPEPMPKNPELSVYGGAFAHSGFYVDKASPLPYCHILANPMFGTLVSDKALGFTWAVNARENKLTPWYNDIATDNEGELLLLRDGEEYFNLVKGSRAFFSKEKAVYAGRTGRFASRITVTIPPIGKVKQIELILENLTSQPLELECAYYTEPVLAVNRDTCRFIQPTQKENVLLLHNPYNTAVSCYSALTAQGGDSVRFVTDRSAFLSGDWRLREPAPSADPCAAAIQRLTLIPGHNTVLTFSLAFGETDQEALESIDPPKAMPESAENRFVIHTPDKALNQFINHFAPHQILASRIYGRTAFFQCGGAFGFRDQLQDVSAYLLIDPAVARRHILRCCQVQFEEGDVLHWWHDLPENAGGLRGVRTRFSDDLIWLPFVTAEYVTKTGDYSLLEEPAAYITAPLLERHEHEKYIGPIRSSLTETVFEHCVRALDKGHNLGENGLPLIGCGDWNDGFSGVGLEGKGRSVWLALFLSMALEAFAPLCGERGRPELAEKYRVWAASLRYNVDIHCWDGRWYLRAFFDNGEPMGAHESAECSIDLLPQSFAVLAGMPDALRITQALDHAWHRLVDKQHEIVRLFDPPFQFSNQQPGYVKAYPRGLRENGGQYTHGAVWFAIALLEAGQIQRGLEVLQMLNPAERATKSELAPAYKVEPYYIAADIYSSPGAEGRGGWSLYTGAAAWYYRAVLEHLLGLRLKGRHLEISPKLPPDWSGTRVEATIAGGTLSIFYEYTGSPGLICDGKPCERISLDGGDHVIQASF